MSKWSDWWKEQWDNRSFNGVKVKDIKNGTGDNSSGYTNDKYVAQSSVKDYEDKVNAANSQLDTDIEDATDEYNSNMATATKNYQSAVQDYVGDKGYENALKKAQEGATQAANSAAASATGAARNTGMSKAAAAAMGTNSTLNAFNGTLENQQNQVANMYNQAVNTAGNVYNNTANQYGNVYGTKATAAGQKATNSTNAAAQDVANKQTQQNNDYNNQNFIQKFLSGFFSDERCKEDIVNVHDSYTKACDTIDKHCRKLSDLRINYK